jgi:protein involved in plasmid replication-relaxation
MTRPSQPELRALPAVAVAVLESLHQHRLLTARQAHALHTPGTSLRWTQNILTQLHQHGLTERAHGPHGRALWFLTIRGADTIQAAGTLAETRRRLTTPAQAAGPLRAHTLAVNDTGIAFVKAAREHAGDDCGPLSWRHEIAHPYTTRRGRGSASLLIADALLSYSQSAPDQSLILHQRFIELDRGTIPAEQLAAKLARYAQLRHHTVTPASKNGPDGPLWRAYYRAFPAVLVVLADQTPAAARRRIQRVIALHRSDPGRGRFGTVPISFVTLADLAIRGPFAPIFISAEQPDTYRDWLGEILATPTER